MAERIEHTPIAWERHSGTVVLYRRCSLRGLWVVGMLTANAYTVTPATIKADHLRQIDPMLSNVLIPLSFVVWFGLIYLFYRLYMKNKPYWLPRHYLQAGRGVKLSVQVLSIPQRTTMGGTLPGPQSRWLVLERPGKKPLRLIQVYHDLDLFKANLALSSPNP